jgi:SnoaL-like polyketide cyclase
MSNQPASANARQRPRDVVLLAPQQSAAGGWPSPWRSPSSNLMSFRRWLPWGRSASCAAKPEAEHEPKHPAVKFILGVWNEGDFSEAEKYVAPDLAMSINGFAYDSTPEGDGPAMAQESVEYWRAIMPDVRMDLSQEIRKKDRIAIEWLITGTHTGQRPELPASGNLIKLPGSAFLTLKNDKIAQVSTVFDALALAVQTGAAEAPAWWPGRSHA